ncbi:unnamed protein product, partial [marine sediment metagenome]
YLVIYRDFDVSTSDYVVVGFDNSGPEYEEGKYWQIDGSLDWGGYASVDLVFEIHGINKEEQTLAEFGPLETGTFYGLRETDADYLLSQSFKLEKTSELTKVKIPLKKISPRVGWVLWVEIHSSQVGTSGTKNASTNIMGEASDNVPMDDLSEDFTWIEFVFSGTKPSLAKHETYVDTDSSLGQKVLKVASTDNFIVGGTVVIGEGTERKEVKIIDSIQAGVSLTMTGNLKYTHSAEKEDLVENSYYLVLYTSGSIPTKPIIPYLNRIANRRRVAFITYLISQA